MNGKLICSVLLVLLVATIAFSDTAEVGILVIENTNKDKQEIGFKMTRKSAKIGKIDSDGKGETIISTRVDAVTTTESIANKTAITTEGKALSGDDLWSRLKPGTIVVFGGEELRQESIRKAFSPDTILLIEKPGRSMNAKTKVKSRK